MQVKIKSTPVLPLPLLRHLYGLRQADLADLLDKTGQTIYRAEKYGPQRTTALSIVQALGIEGDGVEDLVEAICALQTVRVVGLVLETEEHNGAEGANDNEDESSSHGA
jgi:DNA-binding XRE family transcriptional regulator